MTLTKKHCNSLYEVQGKKKADPTVKYYHSNCLECGAPICSMVAEKQFCCTEHETAYNEKEVQEIAADNEWLGTGDVYLDRLNKAAGGDVVSSICTKTPERVEWEKQYNEKRANKRPLYENKATEAGAM